MDGAGDVAGDGHADGAEGQPQRAVGHGDAGLAQFVAVLGLAVESRQEVGVLARRPQPRGAGNAHAQADDDAHACSARSSSQPMPEASDWRNVSRTNQATAAHEVGDFHEAVPA